MGNLVSSTGMEALCLLLEFHGEGIVAKGTAVATLAVKVAQSCSEAAVSEVTPRSHGQS